MTTSLKIILRNINRNPTGSFINISGLAIGMAAFVLIIFWISHETSYDKFNIKVDRTYRLAVSGFNNGKTINTALTGGVYAETLPKELPEVEAVTSIFDFGEAILSKPDGEAFRLHALATNDDFFNVFSINVIKGNTQLLNEPNHAFITERTAKQIYGDEDPIGQILSTGMDRETKKFTVAGIMQDVPDNAHFKVDFLYSLHSFSWYKGIDNDWLNTSFYNYIVLKPYIDEKSFEEKLNNYSLEKIKYLFSTWPEISFEEWEASGASWKIHMQPLGSIHLHSKTGNELSLNGNILYVYIFLIIGVLVLVIALINFINFIINKAIANPKETGIRKISGSNSKAIIFQYLLESCVMSLLAFVVAVMIVFLAMPAFKDFTGIHVPIHSLFSLRNVLWLLAFPFITGILSGIYPAMFMSKISPIKTLTTKFGIKSGKHAGNNLFLISQFVITIIVMAGAFVISKQLDFVQNQNLGLKKENILILKGTEELGGDKYKTFKAELLKNQSIGSVSSSHGIPSSSVGNRIFFNSDGNRLPLEVMVCDEDYRDVYQIELIEGQFFDANFSQGNRKIVVNEKAVKEYGLNNVIGQKWLRNETYYEVIGIVKDFHNQSKRTEILPACFLQIPDTDWFWAPTYFSLRIGGNNIPSTIKYIHHQWDVFLPGKPFTHSFFDQEYDQMYRYEAKTKTLFIVFSGLAIFLSCLGLYSIVKQVSHQRTKEIGIRKVNGAKISEILAMLNRNFVRVVIIAFIIATPIAWFTMDKWLQNFAYKTELSWWIFALAGMLALGIALLTVSWQSWRAATRNPVEALRYE